MCLSSPNFHPDVFTANCEHQSPAQRCIYHRFLLSTTPINTTADIFILSSNPTSSSFFLWQKGQKPPNVQGYNDQVMAIYYRGADKSLARPDWKKQLKGRHFSSDAEVIAAAETWLDGQLS